MQRLLTSIVLCVVAQTAGAQCVNATTATTPAAGQERSGVDLIKTAAAGTRDAPVMAQAPARKEQAGGDEHHRPAGRAMLFAALALMSGIALRRASASDQ